MGTQRRVRGRRGRRVLVVLALLCLIGTQIAAASPSSSSTWDAAVRESAPKRAHLRIALYTTSDWAQVDIPGVTGGHVVAPGVSGLTVRPTGHGVVVNATGDGLGVAVVDLVAELHPNATRAVLRLKGGADGATIARVHNRTGEPTEIATLLSWSTTSRMMPAEEFLAGADLELARRAEGRTDLAFVYPWFGTWATTSPDLPLHPVEVLHAKVQRSALAHARQARAAGIEGFVLSFARRATDGVALHQALEAAAATGGTATALVEPPPDTSGRAHMDRLRDALGFVGHPAHLRLDGTPVVFVYGTWAWSAPTWDAASRLADRAGALLVVDSAAPRGSAVVGSYRYDVLHDQHGEAVTDVQLRAGALAADRAARARATIEGTQPRLSIGTVSPGYDDGGRTPLAAVPRRGSSTYDATWRAAAAADHDWVLVTSWNEWFEATSIAPSVEHGRAALEVTARWAAG